MNIEQLRQEAYAKGDTARVIYLDRLLERLDSQRQSYGTAQRQ